MPTATANHAANMLPLDEGFCLPPDTSLSQKNSWRWARSCHPVHAASFRLPCLAAILNSGLLQGDLEQRWDRRKSRPRSQGIARLVMLVWRGKVQVCTELFSLAAQASDQANHFLRIQMFQKEFAVAGARW